MTSNDEMILNSTFLEHLDEFRSRIMYSLVSVLLFTGLAFVFRESVLEAVRLTAAGYVEKFYFFSPHEAFLSQVKLSLIGGVILSSPILIYHTWMFIGPALLGKEKKHFLAMFFISTPLFLGGVAFAYFFVLPMGLQFLLGFQSEILHARVQLDAYVNFIAMILLGFGVGFLLPIFLYFLSRWEIMSAKEMRQHRPFVLISLFVISAIITPPDVMTLFALALPLYLLFESSLVVISFLEKKK